MVQRVEKRYVGKKKSPAVKWDPGSCYARWGCDRMRVAAHGGGGCRSKRAAVCPCHCSYLCVNIVQPVVGLTGVEGRSVPRV